MHARIAAAIKRTRGKRSAQWLADRTVELGYPITRAQIANYESGRKQSLDIAELIVLAAALNTSPVNLIYPGPYDAEVEVIPGSAMSEFAAAEWFSGVYNYAGSPAAERGGDQDEWNSNVELLSLWRQLSELVLQSEDLDNPKLLALVNKQIDAVAERIGRMDGASSAASAIGTVTEPYPDITLDARGSRVARARAEDQEGLRAPSGQELRGED